MALYLFCYIDNGTNQSYKNDTKIQDIPTVSKVILKESRDDDKFTSRTPGSGKEVDKGRVEPITLDIAERHKIFLLNGQP